MNQTIINPAPNEMKQDCIKVFKKDVTYMFSVQRLPAILVFARYGVLSKGNDFYVQPTANGKLSTNLGDLGAKISVDELKRPHSRSLRLFLPV